MRSSAGNLKQKSPVGRSRPSVSFEDDDDPFVSAKSTPSHYNPPSRPVIPEPDREKLPKRLYATDCYPPIGRINAYSKPEYLLDLVEILEGTKELNYLRASCFGPLFQLPVRRCSFSGKLVHQMLCRGLYTKKKHELWFVFAGQPFRFSLREYAILTGLDCRPYSKRSDILKSQQIIEPKNPYWNVLIGEEHKVVLIKDIVEWLRADKMKPKKDKMDDWRRLRLALIVIVEGILVCSSQPVKASVQVVEMVSDLQRFEAFPWGRESFLLTMRMVKVSSKVSSLAGLIVKFNQSHSSTHGFPLVFQLLMLKAIPEFEKYLPNPDDTQTMGDGSITTLPPLKTFHNSNIMETELIEGLDIAPLLPCDDPPHPSINDWGDEVSDPALDYMESLIGRGYKFKRGDWRGGWRSWPPIVVDQNLKEDNVRKPKKVSFRRPNKNFEIPETSQGGPSKGKGKVTEDEDICPPKGPEGQDILYALIMEHVNAKFRELKDELIVELCQRVGVEKSLMKDELLDEIISNLRHGGKFPTPSSGDDIVPPPKKSFSPGKDKDTGGHTSVPSTEAGGHTSVPSTEASSPGTSKGTIGQTSDSTHVQIDPPAPPGPQTPSFGLDQSKGKSNTQILEEFQKQAWSEYGGLSDVLQNISQSYASPSGPTAGLFASGPSAFGPSDTGPSAFGPSTAGVSTPKFSGDHNPKDFQTPLPTIHEDNAVEMEDEMVVDEVLDAKAAKEKFSHDHNPNDFQTPHQDIEDDETEESEVGENTDQVPVEKSVGGSENVNVVVDCEERKEDVIGKSVGVSETAGEDVLREDKSRSGDDSSDGSHGVSDPEDVQDDEDVVQAEANKAWPPELFKSPKAADVQQVDSQEPNAGGGVAKSKKRKHSSVGVEGNSSKPMLPSKRARNKPQRFRDPVQEVTGTNNDPQTTDDVLHPVAKVNDELRKKFLSSLKNYRSREFVIDGHVVPKSFFKDMHTPQQPVHQEHIDAMLSLLARRFGDALVQGRAAILDSWFALNLCDLYPRFKKSKTKSEWAWNSKIRDYVRGIVPGRFMRQAWFADVDTLYAPFHMSGGHWVALVIDLKDGTIAVLDPNEGAETAKQMDQLMKPLLVLLPFIIKALVPEAHLVNQQVPREFVYDCLPEILQCEYEDDSGPLVAKFIELHFQGINHDTIPQDDFVENVRMRFAVDIFEDLLHHFDLPSSCFPLNMGLHSYTQPSMNSSRESLSSYGPLYPSPMPLENLGIPRHCYCGGTVVLANSLSEDNPGRQFYQCEKREDRPGRHLVKWLDEAFTDEISALKCSIREQELYLKSLLVAPNGDHIDLPLMCDRLDLYQEDIKSLQHTVGLLQRSPRSIVDVIRLCPPKLILVLALIAAFMLGTYVKHS
ncbi:Papain-like cysteine peptidase superfamily [Arabidopsis thaliana x Arabidopsis arenosa]|uniref:Papain-like cysteine peptidase superfamily n=1 Tax=Arabidopsis thaliana x Arabidopsis arenosa TaxID=1240361 RepID=A0A8T1YVF6_9BRAS|nr:Papain-like cysteine peptidase superfamily [Arabidopsis thaliana x Arabidopsis arenosa]